MADEVKDAAPASNAGGADAPAGASGARSDEPLRNLGEVVELKKDTRKVAAKVEALEGKMGEIAELLRTLQPKASTEKAPIATTPDAAAEAVKAVNELRRELAIEKSLAGVTDERVRRLMTMAIKAENPPDVAAYVSENLAVLQPPAQKAPQVAGKSDTGAPGRDTSIRTPDDPNQIDPDTWARMAPKERQEIWQKRLRATGNGGNPFKR